MSLFDIAPDALASRGLAHRARTAPSFHRRLGLPLGLVAMAALFLFGLWWLDFSPARLLGGVAAMGRFVVLMVPPSPGRYLVLLLVALGQTLAIALLGTIGASILAFPVGFLAARNVVPNPVLHFMIRRALDTVRSIDTLVWALMWIAVVGLGPFAGVLAILCSDFGALGKIVSEAIEAADDRAREGVRASGGSRLQEIRFGLLPQVLPLILGQMLYFFESNTRSATIIGIVGAGGIGLDLYEAIRTLEWREVSFIILMILLVVTIIDMISTRLRRALRNRPLEG